MSNGTTLDFDRDDLPLGENLQSVLDVLKGSDIPEYELFRVAHTYRAHYDECREILKFIRESNKDSTCLDQMEMALDLQHGKSVNTENGSFLNGFVYFSQGDYSNALSCFTKERFSFGIDLCNYFYGIPENILLRSLVNLRNMDVKEFESSKEVLRSLITKTNIQLTNDERYAEHIRIKNDVLQDTLYGLRLSDTYSNEDNVDVRQRKAEDLILEGKFEEAISLLGDLVDKNYFYGKIEHLKGNYTEAKAFYKKCISEGLLNTRSYILSKYAYERIVQDSAMPFKFDSESFNDFNVFLKLKNNVEVGDLSGCSEDMRNFIVINKGVSDNLESCIVKYESLVNNKYMEKFIALNNLVYLENRRTSLFFKGISKSDNPKKKEYIKMIKEAVNSASPDVKDVLLYNQAYLTLDVNLFDKLNFQQAKIMSAYLKKDVETLKEMKLIELVACLEDREGAVELLSNKSSLVSNLLLGKLYLEKYVEKKSNIDLSLAISYFQKETKSFYGANGLGVCLAFQSRLSEASKVFNSVVMEHKCAHVNLGNVYILSGEYEKGVLEHLRYKVDSRVVLMLKDHLSLDVLISAYRSGCKNLKEIIFERLLLDNRLEEAKEYKGTTKKLNNLYEMKMKENEKKAEDLKRKIEELEKYKKSKNIK